MKRVIVLSFFLIGIFCSYAQQSFNAVFFTEDGEKFWVILNGIQQNNEPQTNIKITDLKSSAYTVKIRFKDKNINEIDKRIYKPETPAEITFLIKRKRNKYVLRFHSAAPLQKNSPEATGHQYIVPYSSAKNTEDKYSDNVSASVVIDHQRSDANMNINDENFNVNVNIKGEERPSAYGSDVEQEPPEPPADHYVMAGYEGPVGCDWPMEESDFQQAKQIISSKTFEDSKLEIAKQIVGKNCLFADQVKEIMDLFSYEDSKLEFAKYAYSRTYDTGNYFKVYDSFTYEFSIEDLNEYINSN